MPNSTDHQIHQVIEPPPTLFTQANNSTIRAEDVAFRQIQPTTENLYPKKPVSIDLYSTIQTSLKNASDVLHKFTTIPFSKDTFDQFQKVWTPMFTQLDSMTKDINASQKTELKCLFRSHILPYLAQSNIAMRAYSKPFGYPGDFQMLQFLYDNTPPSETNIGKFLDQYFLDDPLAKAVYNRATKMTEEMLRFINESSKESIRILNIASGPGFDLIPIAKTEHKKEVFLDCFDQDLISLMYIHNKIGMVNKNTKFKFIQEDIKFFFKRQDRTPKYDLIYNIGLADYLPDQILKALIRESLAALTPGSEFIIAHKNHLLFPKEHPEWMYDWVFIPRTEEDTIKLVKELNFTGDFSIFYADDTKIVYFLRFRV